MLPFDYKLTRNKTTHNLKIKIGPQGSVVVIAPYFLPKFLVDQFVKKNKEWVITQLTKQKEHKPLNTTQSVHVFGKTYKKKIEFDFNKKIGMHIQGEYLILNPTTQPNIQNDTDKSEWEQKFQEKLELFLKNTASHYIIARTHTIAKKMQVTFNKITLKKQKTRWGSCSSNKNLNFNWQLVHFETAIIDYVIVHELAHLVHMNHSKKFWELVQQYDPEYKKHVGWLKRNGLNLG